MTKQTTIAIIILLVLCIFIVLSLSKHEHTWVDANCLSPKTCSSCGSFEGDVTEHTWIKATCMKPKHCTTCGTSEGDIIEHTWVNATCTKAMHCTMCGASEGDVAEHTWIDATCIKPKHCKICKETVGNTVDHNWTAGDINNPKVCIYCSEMIPLELPQSGQVFIGSDMYRYSELSIDSSSNESCYIKMKNVMGDDIFSFFVRAGDSVTVQVPSGYFYVYFSYGKEWYGTEHIFGPDTQYAKDDELLDFKNYTWEYTLYPTTNGNFTETPIDPEEF